MKRAFRLGSRLSTLDSRLSVVMLSAILLSATSAFALTEANPYTAIVGRNTFALKPPALPAGPVAPPSATPPNVSLQGISTILGRAQALLKVKIAPKPPDAGKELSLVMDVGQREGDVEVLSIDPATGTVNLSNQGSPLTLNIKDADKPVAGPAIAVAAGLPSVPGVNPNPLNTIPTQSLPPSMNMPNKLGGNNASVNVSGAGANVPTRPIRSGLPSQSSINGINSGSSQTTSPSLSREEAAALALLNKEKWKQLGREDISNLIPNPVPQQPVVNPQQ